MKLSRVYVEITNVCNLNCAFCPKTHRPPRMMRPAEFSAVLDKIAPLTQYLCLHLMGEPLLHPELSELLRLAHGAGMHVSLTTNGILLPKLSDALLDAKLYKTSISLHAWEANYGSVPDEAAQRYFAACFSHARAAAEAGTISVLRLWNADRTDRAGDNSLNSYILSALREYFPAPWEDTPRGIRLAPLCYLENEEIFDWPEENAPARTGQVSCRGTRDHIGILADGTVVPCCLDHEGTLALGNIFTDDVYLILESPRVRAMREGFLRGEAAEDFCRRCGYARQKNDAKQFRA